MKKLWAVVLAMSGCAVMPGKYGELFGEVRAAYKASDWETCATKAADLSLLIEDRGHSFITLASCEARLGRLEMAMQHVKHAVEKGYHRDLTKDEDLAPLRTSNDWPDVVAHAKRNREAFDLTLNPELARYAANVEAELVQFEAVDDVNGANRRRRAVEILKSGGARVARDFQNAAVVMQLSMHAPYLQHAIEALQRAIALEPYDAFSWFLLVISTDRLLLVQRKPQHFGSQFFVDNGVYSLAPVDPDFTDAQRAAWYFPPLAAAMKEVEARNKTK